MSLASTGSTRNSGLDGLRAIAVLLVFAFHYGGGLTSSHVIVRAAGYVTQAGWVGVVIFFALSGYLITGSLQTAFVQDATPLGHFYLRRALRILPLYYLALAAALLATLLCDSGLNIQATRNILARNTLAIDALFLQNLPGLAGYTLHHPSPLPLYHLWSLAVEEQFYLLWPPILLFALRSGRPSRPLLLTAAGILLTIVFRIVLFTSHTSPAPFDTFLLTQATAILCGAAVALQPTLSRIALPALMAGSIVYFVSSHMAGTLDLRGPWQFCVGLPAVSLAATALVPLARDGGALSHVLRLPPLPWLGRISYGFYVFHILLQPLFDLVARSLTHASAGFPYQTVRLFAALPITTLFAWISYRFFETPLQRLQPLHR